MSSHSARPRPRPSGARAPQEIAQPPQAVAQAIKFALQQDHGVAINEVVIRPTAQDL